MKIVLATGPYRAQCLMFCHCAQLLLERLPDHRTKLLSPLEKTLALESAIWNIINEDLDAMKFLCEDFDKSLSALIASLVLSPAYAPVATSEVSDDDLMSMICDLHDEFIRAGKIWRRWSVTHEQMSFRARPLWLVPPARL